MSLNTKHQHALHCLTFGSFIEAASCWMCFFQVGPPKCGFSFWFPFETHMSTTCAAGHAGAKAELRAGTEGALVRCSFSCVLAGLHWTNLPRNRLFAASTGKQLYRLPISQLPSHQSTCNLTFGGPLKEKGRNQEHPVRFHVNRWEGITNISFKGCRRALLYSYKEGRSPLSLGAFPAFLE